MLKRLDCTQLEIEELYPAGSNVNGLHSTGDQGALSCWLKRQWIVVQACAASVWLEHEEVEGAELVSYLALARAQWVATGDRGALSCWLKRLRRTQLETAELYPAGSSVFAALNWRLWSSILLAQASWLHSTGDQGALSCWLGALSCWLKRLGCTQLETAELYPAGSSVFAALKWRSRSSIPLAQASSLHSTGDCGAPSCRLKRQWTALNWRSRSSILLAQASIDCTRLEIAEIN